MTAQILNSELSNLIQESKRKQTDLRNAAEKSLDDLKSLRATSEAQLATDLSQRPNFITPFIIACNTKNAKFTGIAIVCLQRLVASRGLPRSRLKEVLEAFREATSSNLDVQLKILQCLPSLLQNYAGDLKGELLAGALNICSLLQSSKNGIVNNTAAATLQQLVVAVFDKVVAEDNIALEVPTVAEAPTESGNVPLRTAAFDAYRVFNDLCLLTESQRPRFLRVAGLPQTFGLELIESVLTNHADIFLRHPEQANILRARVMPFIISSLSDRLSFAITVRVVRILYTLLRRHLSILGSESEMALGLLTHMLDPDTAAWKRSLCMEVFRGLFAEANVVRQIYTLYDAQSGRKAVLGDLVAAFVRISTEKPNIIGLGHQSSIPSGSTDTSNNNSTDQAMLEATGIPGIISSPIASNEVNVGISTQWSSMRIPCIDQLDKADPPSIPESYIYILTLTCINSFSEGLAKFILPLTVPDEIKTRKKQSRPADAGTSSATSESPETLPHRMTDRIFSFKKNPVPLNPLSLVDNDLYEQVKVCAAIVDSCWPAILATCSTFLYSALDAECYHGLVRSFQKFTHVAGLLRLATPRDAFLTTLGKAAVPSSLFKSNGSTSTTPTTPSIESNSLFSNARGLLSVESLASSAGVGAERARQASLSDTPTTLNTRNLLCLRALLNLGIALGPTLDVAWLIILETLQQADFVLFSSSRGAGRSQNSTSPKHEMQSSADNPVLMLNFGAEIKAVETAASRLFESTVDFPDHSFVDVLSALCKLFGSDDRSTAETSAGALSPVARGSERRSSYSHRRIHSISTASPVQNQEDFFALAKLGDVASINIDRLMASRPEISGWTILTSEIITAMTSTEIASPVRLRTVEVLVRIVREAATTTSSLPNEERKAIQWRLLDTFRRALEPLQHEGREASVAASATDIDVHKVILEGFQNILEQCGETLLSGWDITFDIIGSVFIQADSVNPAPIGSRPVTTRSARLVRSAFGPLQLICSDFLSCLPGSCFLVLVDTLYKFCSQDDDLNICLTTVTFFWVLSDFISSRTDSSTLGPGLITSTEEQALVETASSEDVAASNAALWMLLLLRLTTVTADDRLELRNSAIQTLLRIFDAYGDQLSPEAWSMCIQSVIFKMFSSLEGRLRAISDSENSVSEKEKSAWIETAVVVLNGVSDLLSTYLQAISDHASFSNSWDNLLGHFIALLENENLDINTAVFKALRQILSHANTESDTPAKIDAHLIDKVWNLWSRGLPLASSEQQLTAKTNNQACLVAYVSALQEIYRLIQEKIEVEKIQRMLDLLRDAIQQANTETYSADVEYLTSLQTQVLMSLEMIRTDIQGVPSAMIIQASDLIALAFQRTEPVTTKGRPTYIALSKASVLLLESLTTAHASSLHIYTSGSLSRALESLSKPITLKYTFPIATKSLPPWQQATKTSLAILGAVLPTLAKGEVPANDVRDIWRHIVVIANGITSASVPSTLPTSTIQSDQSFDIASFITLRTLITPALGNPLIPDKTRRLYTESLFHTSFIHAPEPDDLPQQSSELLACLAAPRKGRTVDPAPSPRAKMAYLCLDTLFALTAAPQPDAASTLPHVKLAQAAAPYLILRAGLALKTYIADQPLRGRMPQPLSQRKELLCILRRLVELRCEPGAIPDTPNVESEGRRHLHRLFPLLGRMVRVANRDGEVLEWVGRALDVVGDEFGI
ncbi:MAG: hypothetical protein M1818_008204 [Claussenomyces sp. TS43310]|nr:MAG: hypothetical protein M1818_008204 [Claussenomyces sp. TS43310]